MEMKEKEGITIVYGINLFDERLEDVEKLLLARVIRKKQQVRQHAHHKSCCRER